MLEGRKLPELKRGDKLIMTDLVELARAYTIDHKDRRLLRIESKAIKADPIGSRPAVEITPQELDKWLTALRRSAGTLNKYRAFFSLCYREGIASGKVTINPAHQAAEG